MGFPSERGSEVQMREEKQWHILMVPPACWEWGDLRCLKATLAPLCPGKAPGAWQLSVVAALSWFVALLKAQLRLNSTAGRAAADLAYRGSRDRDRT